MLNVVHCDDGRVAVAVMAVAGLGAARRVAAAAVFGPVVTVLLKLEKKC